MTDVYPQQQQSLHEKLRQLKRKRESVNNAFLEALTYVRPFEEVKKLFQELKAIEAEINDVSAIMPANKTA